MLTEQQFTELTAKVGNEAATKIKEQFAASEKSINDKIEDVKKGLMTSDAFETFKAEELAKVTEKLTSVEAILKEQGTAINALKETGNPAMPKTLDDVLTAEETVNRIKEIHKNGSGVLEISMAGITLKTAGSTSIGN